MPRGFGGIRQAAQEAQARRNRAGGNTGAKHLYFSLQPNEEAEVRFLEQGEDVHWAYMHEVPVEGRHWGDFYPCLDQEKDGTPCPGCDRDMDRKVKGYINLIWFDAPVYARDQDGRLLKDAQNKKIIEGRKDQVAVWTSGRRLFENLDETDSDWKGLTSQRFKVKRKGEGFDTTYKILPVDPAAGEEDFSENEKKLAEEKADLNPYVTPGSYEDFLAALGEGSGSGGSNGTSPEATPPNPFLRQN
jgi:hypothetical protein